MGRYVAKASRRRAATEKNPEAIFDKLKKLTGSADSTVLERGQYVVDLVRMRWNTRDIANRLGCSKSSVDAWSRLYLAVMNGHVIRKDIERIGYEKVRLLVSAFKDQEVPDAELRMAEKLPIYSLRRRLRGKKLSFRYVQTMTEADVSTAKILVKRASQRLNITEQQALMRLLETGYNVLLPMSVAKRLKLREPRTAIAN